MTKPPTREQLNKLYLEAIERCRVAEDKVKELEEIGNIKNETIAIANRTTQLAQKRVAEKEAEIKSLERQIAENHDEWNKFQREMAIVLGTAASVNFSIEFQDYVESTLGKKYFSDESLKFIVPDDSTARLIVSISRAVADNRPYPMHASMLERSKSA